MGGYGAAKLCSTAVKLTSPCPFASLGVCLGSARTRREEQEDTYCHMEIVGSYIVQRAVSGLSKLRETFSSSKTAEDQKGTMAS